MSSYNIHIDPRRKAFTRLISAIHRELAAALERECRARNLTQNDLANTLGVNKSAISRRLGGTSNLTLKSISDLAWALGHDVDFRLVSRRQEMAGANHPIATVLEGPMVISSTTGHIARAPLAVDLPQITTEVA